MNMTVILRSYDKLRHYEYALQSKRKQYENTLYNAPLENDENPLLILDYMIECNKKLHTALAYINKNITLFEMLKNTVCDFDYKWAGEDITQELVIISYTIASHVEEIKTLGVKANQYHQSQYKKLKYLSWFFCVAAFVPIFVMPTSLFVLPLTLIMVLSCVAHILNERAKNHYRKIDEEMPMVQDIKTVCVEMNTKGNAFFTKPFAAENTLAKEVQDEYDNFLENYLPM